jgi:hypothetical protein
LLQKYIFFNWLFWQDGKDLPPKKSLYQHINYQPGGLEICNGNGLPPKVVGGSSSFFDLDWLGKPLTIISFGSWRARYMMEYFSWYWQSTAPWHFSSIFLLETMTFLFSYCVRALEWDTSKIWGQAWLFTIMISPYGSNAPLLGPYPTPFTWWKVPLPHKQSPCLLYFNPFHPLNWFGIWGHCIL